MLEYGLGIPPDEQTMSMQFRMGELLSESGFEQHRPRVNGVRRTLWRPTADASPAEEGVQKSRSAAQQAVS